MNNVKKVGYVYDERMLLHVAKGQFENPDRIIAIHRELEHRCYLHNMARVKSAFGKREAAKIAAGGGKKKKK